MPTYHLIIEFSEPDLDFLHATRTNLMVAKGTTDGGPDIVWMSVLPEPHCEIAWEETTTAVFLWTQASLSSDKVITDVNSPVTRVEFGDGVTEATVRYDGSSRKFLPVA